GLRKPRAAQRVQKQSVSSRIEQARRSKFPSSRESHAKIREWSSGRRSALRQAPTRCFVVARLNHRPSSATAEARCNIETVGDFTSSEGDIVYAPPWPWHATRFAGPGPSCRLAISAYQF